MEFRNSGKGKDLILRAVTGCLPTRSQLRSKHVQVQGECLVWHNELETIYHVFVECPFAVMCWTAVAVAVAVSVCYY